MPLLKKVFLSLFSVLIFLACSSQKGQLKNWMEQGGKPRILSTITQIGDLVTYIGGERIESIVLVRGELDPHSYELVKGDNEKFNRADRIFYHGLGLEHGASLSSWLKNNKKSIAIGDRIAMKYPEKILKRGDVVDPHIWMDISLWGGAIDPIVEELIKVDEEGAEYYRERGNALALEMKCVHDDLKRSLSQIPSKRRYLMTSHDAFRYFTRTYLADEGEEDWMSRFAAPEGLAPDGQLNPHDIQQMIAFLRERRVSVIFPESNVSRDSINKVAAAGKEMGIDLIVSTDPLYGDSTNGQPYLESMRINGQVLVKHLR